MQPGDVILQGGYPGHAVLVVDVAVNSAQQRVFLLAQSFMLARQIHVLRNPDSQLSPWFKAQPAGILKTPEWEFQFRDLRRFPRS